MSTYNVHALTFRQPVLFMPIVGTTDDTETLEVGDDLVMVVTLKTLQADPVPAAPVFHASMVASAPVDVTGIRGDAATNRYTQFQYSFNPAWTMNAERVSDAALPYAVPTNVYNFLFKDDVDTASSFTTVVWFTV